MNIKVMVIGAGGAIGFHIARGLAEKCEVIPVIHDFRPAGMSGAVRVDITNAEGVENLVRRIRPDAVVNTAALTNADFCEKNRDAARLVNVTGARNVARACEKSGARLVHYSTDLVFDGRKGMYREEDEPNPLNTYAVTKLESEKAVLSISPGSAVLRTAIVYGRGSGRAPSFFETVIEKVKKGESVPLFVDQYRTFLYVEDSAAAVFSIIENGLSGVYHVSGDERAGRYDFMARVLRGLELPTESLERVRMTDLPDLAPRPADCSLDNSKLKRETGWRPSGFEESLEKIRKFYYNS